MEGVWRDEDTTVWCRCQQGKCGVSSLAPQPIALYTPRLLARFCCLGVSGVCDAGSGCGSHLDVTWGHEGDLHLSSLWKEGVGTEQQL